MQKRGRPRKDQQDEGTSYRAALSLMPGRLMVRNMIERELEEIRAGIRSGKSREWIALLPGMEMEFDRVTADLGTLLGLVGSSNGHGEMEQEREEIEPAQAEVLPEARQLAPAPAETAAARGGGKTVDVGTLFSRTEINGRPILRLYIVQELMEKGEINRKEFVERYIGSYPSLKFTSTLGEEVMQLRKRGVNFAPMGKSGFIRLKTNLTGTLPWPDQDRKPLEMPARPEASEVMFSGSQSAILLQEFEAAPDHTVNVTALYEKYKVARNAFHWAMTSLRTKRGLKFTNVSRGVFRLEQSRSSKRATA